MLLLSQFLLNWKLYLRERSAIFWTFGFSILMLLAFGFIFRSGGGPTPTLVWVVAGAPDPQVAEALAASPLKVVRLDPAAAEAKWKRSETAALLEARDGALRLRVNAYLAAQGQPAAQMAQQALLIAEARRQGAKVDPVPVSLESPAHRPATNYAAFLLPGILGMNLLSMGLWAVGMVNVQNREKGIFRRLAVTPLPTWVFLGGQILHRLSVFVLQSAVLLLVGRLVFGISNQGSLLGLSAVLILGAACFMAMGFAFASLPRTMEGYAALSNAAFFPMMLLSGVYFTLEGAPKWLQAFSYALPLSPFLKALRGVFNDGALLSAHAANLALVGAWTVGCFVLAMKKFRWT